jgi:hypothetical protein
MLMKMSRQLPARLMRLLGITLDPTLELPISEQTELSWAKAIRSYAEVPPAYRSFFEPLESAGVAFPGAILTPTFAGFLRPAAEQLVCHIGEELFLLRKAGAGHRMQCFLRARIQRVEMRRILLDSRIRIFGTDRAGTPEAATLRFNTVTDGLFEPLLAWMRGLEGDPAPEEVAKFDGWLTVCYKFRSFARRGLMGGERAVRAVLQPAIERKRTVFPRLTFRRIVSQGHAVILTDRELVLIREESDYGGIWHFLPRRPAAALALAERQDGLLLFTVRTADGVRLEFLFERTARGDLEEIQTRWQETAV